MEHKTPRQWPGVSDNGKQASHLWEILEKGHGGCKESPRGQLAIKDLPNRLNSCPVSTHAILHALGKKTKVQPHKHLFANQAHALYLSIWEAEADGSL